MRFVTTCHYKGFEQYGEQFMDGLRHLPIDAEVWWYTEGFDLPDAPVKAIRNETLERLQRFKERYAFYRSPYYLYDVVRFANKVFAVHDALRDYNGIGVWIDADMIPYRDVPSGYVKGLLNKGDYLAMFRRRGFYSECGFYVMDCAHPAHKKFWDTFIDVYESDTFKRLKEWHDSYLMDVVVRQLESDGEISVTNLSGKFVDEEHPMAKADIARFFDHLKGPDRKALGSSPENEFRKAA